MDLRLIREKAISLGIITPTQDDFSKIDISESDFIHILSDQVLYNLICEEINTRAVLDVVMEYDKCDLLTEEWIKKYIAPGTYLYEKLEEELDNRNFFGKKTKKQKLF